MRACVWVHVNVYLCVCGCLCVRVCGCLRVCARVRAGQVGGRINDSVVATEALSTNLRLPRKPRRVRKPAGANHSGNRLAGLK